MSSENDSKLLKQIIRNPKLRCLPEDLKTVTKVCKEVFAALRSPTPTGDSKPSSDVFVSLINKAFDVRHKDNEKIDSDLNTKLNVLTVYCSESAQAAAEFNTWLLKSAQFASYASPKIWWKILSLFQLTYWLDETSTLTETSILALELISKLYDRRLAIFAPSKIVTLVVEMINGYSRNTHSIGNATSLDGEHAFSDSVPESVQLLLFTIFSYNSPAVQISSVTASGDDLWSPDPFERVCVAKYHQVDALTLINDNTNASTPFYIWAMLAIEKRKPATNEEIMALKTLASTIINRALKPSKPQRRNTLMSIQKRQEQILLNTYVRTILHGINSKTLSNTVKYLGTHFTLVIKDQKYCKAHISLQGVCEFLREMGPTNYEIDASWTDIINFLNELILDVENDIKTKILAVEAASNLIQRSEEFSSSLWDSGFLESTLSILDRDWDLRLAQAVFTLYRNFLGLSRLFKWNTKQRNEVTLQAWRAFSARISVEGLLRCTPLGFNVKSELLLLMSNVADYIKAESYEKFDNFLKTTCALLFECPSYTYDRNLLLALTISLSNNICGKQECEYIIDAILGYSLGFLEWPPEEGLDILLDAGVVIVRAALILEENGDLIFDRTDTWIKLCELITKHPLMKEAKLGVRTTWQSLIMRLKLAS